MIVVSRLPAGLKLLRVSSVSDVGFLEVEEANKYSFCDVLVIEEPEKIRSRTL